MKNEGENKSRSNEFQINNHNELHWLFFIFQKLFLRQKRKFSVPLIMQKCQCQDFQMVHKMCCINKHNNMIQKFKEIKSRPN